MNGIIPIVVALGIALSLLTGIIIGNCRFSVGSVQYNGTGNSNEAPPMDGK